MDSSFGFAALGLLAGLVHALAGRGHQGVGGAAGRGVPWWVRASPFGVAALGLLAGLVHALAGPDHLSAVAPLVVEERRSGGATGLLWGLGHSVGGGGGGGGVGAWARGRRPPLGCGARRGGLGRRAAGRRLARRAAGRPPLVVE